MTTLHYDATLDDAIDAISYHNRKAFSLWRGIRLLCLFLILIFLMDTGTILYYLDFRLSDMSWHIYADAFEKICGPVLYAFCILLLTFPLLTKWLYLRRCKAQLRKGKNLSIFGSRTLTIDPKDVAVETPYVHTNLSWRAVEKVEKSESSIFIYVSVANTWSIPHRAFESDSAFQAFYEECQKYYVQAQNTESKVAA